MFARIAMSPGPLHKINNVVKISGFDFVFPGNIRVHGIARIQRKDHDSNFS
jgi:hypothetical protein